MTYLTLAFLLPLATIGAGIWLIGTCAAQRERCSSKTLAMVVCVHRSMTRNLDGHLAPSFVPVYEYATEGRTIRQEAPFFSRKASTYRVGQIDEIFVNPSNPKEFIRGSEHAITIMGGLLVAAGALAFSFPLLTA